MKKLLIAPAVLVFAIFFLVSGKALAHDGEHEGKDHPRKHSRFEEGSGSSVMGMHPGEEYSEKDEAYREGSEGEAGKASTGHSRDAHEKGERYEEGSGGMKGEHRGSMRHRD